MSIFNSLNFNLLNSSFSYGGLKFGYSFKTHNYYCCMLYTIAQVAGPLLLRVM